MAASADMIGRRTGRRPSTSTQHASWAESQLGAQQAGDGEPGVLEGPAALLADVHDG